MAGKGSLPDGGFMTILQKGSLLMTAVQIDFMRQPSRGHKLL